MKLLLINLDRHPMRLKRMENLLQGLAFERIAAVDGRTIEGLEKRVNPEPISRKDLSRYERACILSHRAAWSRFLAGADRYCCILEDDVFISPDFSLFMNDESWIPERCDLMKIETYDHPVFISRKKVPCLNRHAVQLHSTHLGTGAYVLSRNGASVLLNETADPDRALDRILFDETAIRRRSPICQLLPALCIQGRNLENGILFPEMRSSINQERPKKKKTVLKRIKKEIIRPLRQLKKFAERKAFERRMQACLSTVAFL